MMLLPTMNRITNDERNTAAVLTARLWVNLFILPITCSILYPWPHTTFGYLVQQIYFSFSLRAKPLCFQNHKRFLPYPAIDFLGEKT